VVAWGAGPEASGGYERAAPFASVFQDWRYWLQEGIVDYVVPMDYYREASQQADWFDAWTRFQVANPGKRGVAIGVASFLNSLDASMAQLTRARALAPLGVALYSYAVPARDLEDPSAIDRESVAARLRLLFPRPAPVPDLPVTSGLAVDVPGHEDVAITADNGEGGLRTWRTDGTGLGGAGDLQPGRYRVTISAPDVDPTPFEVRVTPGTMTLVRLGPGTPVS
jgi:hypothetical protein